MRIVIGCDHIVTDIKVKLRDYLIDMGYEVVDIGTYDFKRTHYPIFGKRVAEEVTNNHYDFGIVICGTGVGISNSAQKIKGARVVLVNNLSTARIAREQYDANIIAFGGRITGLGIIEEATEIFLTTKFKGDKNLVSYLDNLISKESNKNEYFAAEQAKWQRGEYHD